MNSLKAKLKKQGGFTLVELLIVVAIIAVLVAVSIPMMNSALEKSRHAVDQANARDAVALASMKYLTDPEGAVGDPWNYCVDGNNTGYLSKTDDGVKPQCKCNDCAVKDAELTVTITAPAAGSEVPGIELSWTNDGTGGATKAPGGTNPNPGP